MSGLLRWLNAPANWCGLLAATGVLVLKALGLLGAWGLGVAAIGYGAGLAAGALWWGWPSTKEDAWEALKFEDEGDAREAMGRALSGVRRLGSAVEQQHVVDQRGGLPAQPAGDALGGARRAGAERVGPAVGRAGAEDADVHHAEPARSKLTGASNAARRAARRNARSSGRPASPITSSDTSDRPRSHAIDVVT